jgi:Tfp pilus assembly protein PilO
MSGPGGSWRPDRNQLLTAGLAVALLGCFVGLVYLPNSRAAQAAARTLQERQAELAERMTQVRQLPELVDRVARMEPEYAANLARIPSEPRVAEFLRQVADTLVAENIAKREVVPQGERAAQGFMEMPVDIRFEAPFAAVYRVLARLEALERVSRVESLRLSSVPDGKGIVHVEMKIVVFHSSPSGQEAVKSAAGPGKAARS